MKTDFIPIDYARQITQYRRHRDTQKLARSLPIANPREKQAVIDWIVQNIH
ncbi:hypothetical protein [Leptolyngbya ohadii]|uniref:hypothetical protein n=1 Tax=Leptolyngbya ohadii TaxID=1962290 RepID=UPI0015C600AB|nr:hypothetical protein [Leptolyngbya ohadii]